MNESTESRSVSLTRIFDAPIDLVYLAWADGEHVSKWMMCDAAATFEVENWEPAVGVEFKTHMFLEGVFEVWGAGHFTHVNPPNLLAYTSDADAKLGTPEMHIRVELIERDGKTELTLTHSGIPTDELCGIIEGGWTNSLGMLADVAAALVRPETRTGVAQ